LSAPPDRLAAIGGLLLREGEEREGKGKDGRGGSKGGNS